MSLSGPSTAWQAKRPLGCSAGPIFFFLFVFLAVVENTNTKLWGRLVLLGWCF